MKAKFIFLTLTIVACYVGHAQVTLQTGGLNYSVPLIDYNDAPSGLSLKISLDYTSANGIKVDEHSSEVGLGWSLNAGGKISRIKVGEPDDQTPITISNDITIPAGKIYAPLSGYNNLKLCWNPRYDNVEKNYYDPLVHFDRERDEFIYTINEMTGKFIIGDYVLPKEEELTGRKIQYMYGSTPGVAGTLGGFRIIDAKGIQYVFENKVLNALMKYYKGLYKSIQTNTGTGYQWVIMQYVTVHQPRNAYFPDSYYMVPDHNNVEVHVPYEIGYKIADAWYISEISNPQTGKKITFNYADKTYAENGSVFVLNSASTISGGGHTDNSTGLIINETIEDTQYPELNSITFPDGKSISFRHDRNKLDQPGKKALTGIDFFNFGILTSKYDFDYGYFYGNSVLNESSLPSGYRQTQIALALKSVTKTGADGSTEPPLKFDYYSGSSANPAYSFPERNTFGKDHWGYYNGLNANVKNASNQLSFLALRDWVANPNVSRAATNDINIAQIGMLKNIYSKYGGKTEIIYSLNKCLSGSSEVYSGGVKVDEIRTYDSPTDFKGEKYNYLGLTGYSSADHYDVPDYHSAPFGEIVTPNFSRYNSYKGSIQNLVTIGQQFISTIGNKAIAGATTAKIAALAPGASTIGVVAFLTNVGYLYELYSLLRMTGLFTTTAWSSATYTTDTYSSAMNTANNYVAPNYSRVTISDYGVKNSITLNEGKTVYNFVSALDKPLLVNTLAYPFSNKQRKPGWQYNQPSLIEKYDNNNTKVYSKLFTYTDYVPAISATDYASIKIGAQKIVSSPDDPAHSQVFTNYSGLATPYIVYDNYNWIAGKSYLTSTQEREYGSAGNYVQKQTEYEYNPTNYLPSKIKTYDSKNAKIETRIYYSTDFTGMNASTLAYRNNIADPLVTEVWKTNPNESPKLLSTKIVEFGTSPNTDLKPVREYGLETTAPIPESSIGVFDPNNIIRDPNRIKPKVEYTYDNKGNAVEQKFVSGNKTDASIYNSSNEIVASAINASKNEIAYSSLESGETAEGNFDIGVEEILVEPSPTGSQCARLAYDNGVWVKTINPVVKKSVFSFWSTSTDFKINNASVTPVSQSEPINGWTYYEFIIPANTSQVMLTGNMKVDEIRLYPFDAKMTTATFNLSLNKTSDCDENNRIQYYEMDDIGRMKIIRDARRNVIKTFEYHFKN